MPTYSINTDTLTAEPPITNTSTVQTVIEQIVFRVGSSYQQSLGSDDLNDALADYLASMQQGRQGAIPVTKQIRQHAAGLLAAGVAGPGGKLVVCSQAHVDNLTTAAALTAAQIGALSLAAVDGTRWPVNTPARATTLRTAMTARIAAVNAVRDAAITSFQALTPQEKRDFQFGSIVWPA